MPKITKKTVAKATATAKKIKAAPTKATTKKAGVKKAGVKKATIRKLLPKKLLKAAKPAPITQLSILDRLFDTISSRRDVDPSVSHSARLLSRGRAKVAQKFGEEAVECLIEAVAGNRNALVAESADVLYHLLVMWVDLGVEPQDVWAELERRQGVSGIAEKAARPQRMAMALGIGTTKIP
jgi:phosphoribosyl-ATP pyrophosphohydrolase